MSLNPKLLIENATKCLEEADEVSHRNAAQNAYYGCYHAATKLVDRLGLTLVTSRQGGVHQQLIDTLTAAINNKSSKTCRSIGYKLANLKIFRIEAGYEMDKPFLPGQARAAVEGGLRLFKCIEDALAENAQETKSSTNDSS